MGKLGKAACFSCCWSRIWRQVFEVAVPAHDPTAVVAVKEVGALLRASVQRQLGLVAG